MDAIEYTRLVDSAKQKFEHDTALLRERLEGARMAVMREEDALRIAQEALVAQINALTRRFVGLDVDAETTSAPVVQPAAATTPPKDLESQSKRRAMDGPLLEIARSLPQPFSAPQVWEAWNAAHPDEITTRSTARGVLERHLAKGRLELADAGGRGSFNPKTYRVRA